MQIITEYRIVKETEIHLYSGSWHEKFGLIFYLYSMKTLEGSLTHKRVQISQQVINNRKPAHMRYQTSRSQHKNGQNNSMHVESITICS